MSCVWGMILQWGSTIEVSIELRHRCDMTEILLKGSLNLNKQHKHFIVETDQNVQKNRKIWCSEYSKIKWASSWDYGTYHIGDQRRHRWACTSVQSSQSLRCSHALSMEVDKRSSQNQTSSPTGWMRMRIWRMSLWRTESAIISWHGSYRILEYIKRTGHTVSNFFQAETGNTHNILALY